MAVTRSPLIWAWKARPSSSAAASGSVAETTVHPNPVREGGDQCLRGLDVHGVADEAQPVAGRELEVRGRQVVGGGRAPKSEAHPGHEARDITSRRPRRIWAVCAK